jgi:hypothetical protein
MDTSTHGYKGSLVILLLIVFSGCSFIENATKHDFADGAYRYRKPGEKVEKVFATVSEDTVTIYPLLKEEGRKVADTSRPTTILLQKVTATELPKYGTLRKTALDVDLMTIIFKYRPEVDDMPNQLNSNFNAALYLGYRKDYFRIQGFRSPMPVISIRKIHFGFDAGFYAGFSTAVINPWVTNNNIEAEYDGFVFQRGIGAFMGVEDFGFGLVLGFDSLLDENKKYWIYQRKPYIGFAIGLTLN